MAPRTIRPLETTFEPAPLPLLDEPVAAAVGVALPLALDDGALSARAPKTPPATVSGEEA